MGDFSVEDAVDAAVWVEGSAVAGHGNDSFARDCHSSGCF
jgi:hypothetical protein